MDANTLFAKTLEDIESRLLETDPYEILMIAGLLRKLFLDDHPLVDQVNRTHRVKFEFEVTVPVNKPDEGDTNSLWSVLDGLDPDTAIPGKARLKLSRDQFFQTVVAIVYGPSYTVRDVIQFEANVAGAVHAGAPGTEKEKALYTVGHSIGVGGYAPTLRQLLAIARVSLKALAPLRAALNAA
jgi:hypothetical protein